MSATHHIFLIPGFFGFVNFGRLMYFAHVREYLEDALVERGLRVAIHRCATPPTASLRARAAELQDTIQQTAPPTAPLHLIGHSTGGLDARLFATPGVDLDNGADTEPVAAQVQTVIGVCAPHFGTPLAAVFTSILGQKFLRLLSVATVFVLREGRLPVSLVARFAAVLARLGLPGGKSDALLDHLAQDLMGHLPESQRDQVSAFFKAVGQDQGLLPQLTPEGADLFNATAVNRDGVRYGSVVARAEPASMRQQLAAARRPYLAASYALYQALSRYAVPAPSAATNAISATQRAALKSMLGDVPSARDTDGVVPTLSHVRGDVIAGARADHLDVIGHFADEQHDPPHHDWIETRSQFRRSDFERMWSAVADYIAGAAAA